MKHQIVVGMMLAISCILPSTANSQEVYEDLQAILLARVVEVVKSWNEPIPGSEVKAEIQTIRAEILEGENKGTVITFENDYLMLKEGETFFLNYLVPFGGEPRYSVHEKDRRGTMGALLMLFAGAVLLLSGKQGLRSLLALLGSLAVIAYVLLPSLLSGFPPVATAVAVATGVLFFAIFFTHGFNRASLSAFLGTVISVALAGTIAHYSILFASLSGFSSDEAIYLNLNTGGTLDFSGLLLAGIIIGMLGVLDDIAVTQTSVVRELMGVKEHLTKMQIFKKSLRVGREHVGALVNTLVLAYTGAALPLLLLFSTSESGLMTIINREIFATEIVRALVGSIGLVLAVPITTALSMWLLKPEKKEH